MIRVTSITHASLTIAINTYYITVLNICLCILTYTFTGAICWDASIGSASLLLLENAVREAELFIKMGTSQNGKRMIPNAGPGGEGGNIDYEFTQSGCVVNHCSQTLVKLVRDGLMLVQMRRGK